MIAYAVHPKVLLKLQNQNFYEPAQIYDKIIEALKNDEAIYIGSLEEAKIMSRQLATGIKELIAKHRWQKVYLQEEREIHEDVAVYR